MKVELEFDEIKTVEQFVNLVRGMINQREILILKKTPEWYAICLPFRGILNTKTRLIIVPINILLVAKPLIDEM